MENSRFSARNMKFLMLINKNNLASFLSTRAKNKSTSQEVLFVLERCVPLARNEMCPSGVMFPLEVKCAFGTCYGTHCITANEVSNITMRCRMKGLR